MDNIITKNPTTLHGMTPLESAIMDQIVLLRDHEEEALNVLQFVKWNVDTINRQPEKALKKHNFKKFCGIIRETGESDKQRLSRILKEKYKTA